MDVLTLFANKHVQIAKNPTNYAVICLKRESTPGAYSKINVEKNTWYTIEVCCTKFGYGMPGLWIATPDKKTLFYGNYFAKPSKGYLKRSFYTGNYSVLLIGILVKNATVRSGFILEKLSITEVDLKNIEDEEDPNNIEKKKSNAVTVKDDTLGITYGSEPSFKSKINYMALIDDKTNTLNTQNIYKPLKNVDLSCIDEIVCSKNTTILDNVLNTNDNTNHGDVSDKEYSGQEEYSDQNITDIDEVKNIYNIKKTYGDIDFNINVTQQAIGNFKVYPISLGIPKEMVLETIGDKCVNFFNYNLDEPLLSKYKKNTKQFYKDLEKSRFILISKHEYGIDEPIYYEALSKGCIPLFINGIPDKSSVLLPKEVIQSIKNVKGVNLGWIDENKFSRDGFNKISNHLLNYTREHLTTESIADYLIHIANKEIQRVLFLANSRDNGDFLLQQSLLHGLKKKLGSQNVIDYPKVLSLYRELNPNENVRLGLPYNNTLEESNVSRGRINKRIENREFDLIIVMGVFTCKNREVLKLDQGDFPYSKEIKEYYDKTEIFFIDGTSNNNEEPILHRLYKYANQGICFYKDFI